MWRKWVRYRFKGIVPLLPPAISPHRVVPATHHFLKGLSMSEYPLQDAGPFSSDELLISIGLAVVGVVAAIVVVCWWTLPLTSA